MSAPLTAASMQRMSRFIGVMVFCLHFRRAAQTNNARMTLHGAPGTLLRFVTGRRFVTGFGVKESARLFFGNYATVILDLDVATGAAGFAGKEQAAGSSLRNSLLRQRRGTAEPVGHGALTAGFALMVAGLLPITAPLLTAQSATASSITAQGRASLTAWPARWISRRHSIAYPALPPRQELKNVTRLLHLSHVRLVAAIFWFAFGDRACLAFAASAP